MKKIILWGGLVVLIVGMAGAIGLYMRAPIDYRVATYPQFNCGSADRYCNTATAAGLMEWTITNSADEALFFSAYSAPYCSDLAKACKVVGCVGDAVTWNA